MYFQLLKKYFFDMLSLENIISDIVPNVSNKQEKFVTVDDVNFCDCLECVHVKYKSHAPPERELPD